MKKSQRYDVSGKHMFARAIMNQIIIAAFASVVVLLLAVVVFAGVIICVWMLAHKQHNRQPAMMHFLNQ